MPRVGYLWFGFLVLVAELGVAVAVPEWVELGLWVGWFALVGLAAAASCDCSCS